MKTYLIDTENLNSTQYNFIEPEESNKIIFFYTEKSGKICFNDFKNFVMDGASLEFISCFTGNNGLDFQLVSYLGYLLNNNSEVLDEYLIISRDKGFDAVCKFWTERGYKVKRVDDKCVETSSLIKEVGNVEVQEETNCEIDSQIDNTNATIITDVLVKMYQKKVITISQK